MNEMYNMSIVAHNYSVIGILGTIFINIMMLFIATDIKKYSRFMTIFMPIGMTVIGTIIFSGVVMMAAKHLEFSEENILMIIFAIVLIVLENTRSKKLQCLGKEEDESLSLYKKQVYKIFMIEIIMVLSISIWMWL
ncbi:MAG: hypothetical protein ACI9RG_000337 [Sulfurimonas sp.]|jgi:hypothetical protein